MKKAIVVAVSAVTAVERHRGVGRDSRLDARREPCGSELQARDHRTHRARTPGPAGAAGLDQRNWGRVFLTNWNAGRAIPGVPAGFKRTKLKAIEADTQLNPQVAATVAVQLRSNRDVLAVNAFSGSQENVAGGPILRRGGLAFVSGSATRASLTDPSTPDGGCPEERLLPPRRPARQLPGRHRRDVHAAEARRRRGRHGDGRRSGRGVLGAAHHRCGEPASGGQRRGRPPVSAGGADRLHVARQQGGRTESEGRLLRDRRSPRTRSCSSSSSSRGATRASSSARTARSTRTTSRCRARTSRRSASTSTTCRSRGRSSPSSRRGSATRSRSALRRSSPSRRSRWASRSLCGRQGQPCRSSP